MTLSLIFACCVVRFNGAGIPHIVQAPCANPSPPPPSDLDRWIVGRGTLASGANLAFLMTPACKGNNLTAATTAAAPIQQTLDQSQVAPPLDVADKLAMTTAHENRFS